ncbi:MAG: cytochrome P450 [Chloroflexota bacterium]
MIQSLQKAVPEKTITLQEARELQTDTLGFIMKTTEELGDIIKLKVGFWDIYFLNHPEYIKHIFQDNWKNYGRDTFQFNHFARVTGKGLLTAHGDYWQKHRKLAQPGFHKNKLNCMASQMGIAIDRMHGRWDMLLKGKQQTIIDIDAEMLRLGLEIVGSALFSLDFSQDSAKLSQEILGMMQYVVYRSQNLLALPTWIPTPRNLKFRRTLKKVDGIIYNLIDERVKSGQSKNDLLDLFLDGRDENNQPIPKQAIRDEIITMIIAGYETVASGMSWMWDVLTRHPEVESKIDSELQNWDGESSTDVLRKLPYTSAAIDEVFRLYPPSWLVTRRSLKDDVLGEYSIPQHSIVVVCPYAIHRHPTFWLDHDEYRPERHLSDYANKISYAYIPFGGGPHLCIGRPFARLEAGLVLAKTVKRYRLKPTTDHPTELNPQVTLRPKNGLKLTLSPK